MKYKFINSKNQTELCSIAKNTIFLHFLNPIIIFCMILLFGPFSATMARSSSPLDYRRQIPLDKNIEHSPVAGKTIIFLHQSNARSQPVLMLQVPNRYVGEHSDALNLIGFSFFATYPSLLGAHDVSNIALSSCGGFCNGRMLIELNNQQEGRFLLSNFVKLISRDHILHDIQKSKQFGFNYVETGNWGGPNNVLQTKYYLFDEQKQIKRYVQCLVSVPNPTCEEWFIMPSEPRLTVHYTFSNRFIKDSFAVRHVVQQLVGSFLNKN